VFYLHTVRKGQYS